MFMLWKRRHDRCLQIFDRISYKNVNRFVLECPGVKLKGRQILAHLCSFFAQLIFTHLWRTLKRMYIIPILSNSKVIWYIQYILLYISLIIFIGKNSLGQNSADIYWVFPMCPGNMCLYKYSLHHSIPGNVASLQS